MSKEAGWRKKTLEELEDDYWREPEYDSHLIVTCHQLRKKKLEAFQVEDLRIMIGQNIGLKFLIPIAMEVLDKNILAQGDFYEGDLLKNVLTCDEEYWQKERGKWKQMKALFKRNEQKLLQFETTNAIRTSWFRAFDSLEKI